ncbi:S-adenosyl-L-methionine-dependent methyltransferase, partial [Corynespora cassiicola Philippines]
MAGPPIVTVQLPPPDFPRSYAPNWIPPGEHVDEMDAIENIKEEWVRYPVDIPEYDSYTTSRKILIADVNDYEIYISPGHGHRQDSELQPLHHFDTKAKSLSLDGFVSLGNFRHWIEMSAITSYSIEGYDDDGNPGIVVYVQTEAARSDQDYDIWYCLKRPAPPYRRVDKAFRWVSTFGKHVMDYLAIQPIKSVGLDRFRNDFARWLTARFPRNEELKKWMRESQTKDFRMAFHAYVDYLAYQAWNLPESAGLLSHPVWADCMKGDQRTIKQQPIRTKGTITSPTVYRLFKHMYFGECLKEMAPVHEVQQAINKRKQMLGFPKEQDADFVPTSTAKDSNSPIKPGDVVSIRPDEREQKTWGTPGEDWLAYVQGVSPLEDGTMKLSVLWIYHPSDTTIAGAIYPVEREVFLSDNCNCGDLQLRSTDVIRRFTVDWSPKDLNTSKELIIRSKYTENKCFVTLKDEDRQCTCGKPKPSPIDGCRPGETIYYSTVKDGQKILEPGVVRRVNKSLNEITVQRFLRLKRDCPRTPDAVRPGGIADNELVLMDTTINVPAARIDRKCKLRFFPKKIVLSGEVPFPYNLGGAIDFWFFSMEQLPAQQLTFISKAPSWIRQGADPGIDELPDQLRGLSMFSGSGNLDRGLEEGGAVKFEWSVDMSGHAVHTQRANAIDQDKLNIYWGSVDDYLKALLEGHNMTTVARIGNVMFIAAGSPCPGFSCMQQNILSEQSKRNSSHITTFATAVDMYRPLYGILENVPHMSAKRKGLENQNVLSQVVACLVSLGYQVTQFLMDSWNFGSPQRRSRLFIAVTAPGLEPIMAPIHTHSSPEKTTNKSLGTLRNGEKFGEREFYPTPFETVTAGQATAHLPHIGTSNIQTCIRFPDHRLVGIPNRKDRKLMEHIPTFPPSQGYAEAVELGLMPQSLMKKMKENKRSFRRIDQNALFPTIKTNLSPQDGRGDASLHWEEHRPIGVQEAREAQGFPRTEVLIGSTLEQWRLIGNAVDRKVSLAQGFVLREAV